MAIIWSGVMLQRVSDMNTDAGDLAFKVRCKLFIIEDTEFSYWEKAV